MCVKPERKPSAASTASPIRRPPARCGTDRSRREIDTGLTHSCMRICSGRGRYQSTCSNRICPSAQMVSKVNSSPSTNSSTLTSGTCRSMREHRVELLVGVDAVGVGRAGAGDRLDDERVADLLRGLPDLGDGARADVPRRADARGVEHALHRLLVAERHGLLDGHAGQAERPRGCGPPGSCTAPRGTPPGRSRRAGTARAAPSSTAPSSARYTCS